MTNTLKKLMLAYLACGGGAAAAQIARADLYTVAGVTWDSDNAFTTASGSTGIADPASWPAPVLVGEEHLSFGVLTNGGAGLRRATLGDQGNSNALRHIVTLSFDAGFGLPNLAGDDLVVYEQGDANEPEGYAVAVRRAGESSFSAFRYKIWDSQEGDQIATTFDLSDFGVDSDVLIDAIQIMNLQQYVDGGSSVIDYTPGGGSGVVETVVGFGSPTVGNALPIGYGATKSALIPTTEFDPDISYAGGLHALAAIPEASSFLTVALAGMAYAAVRLRSRSNDSAGA